MATQDPNFERDPNERNPIRREYEDYRGAGWGAAISAIIIVILVAVMVSWFWKDNERSVAVEDQATGAAPSDIDTPAIPDRLPDITDEATPAAEVQQPPLTLPMLTQNPADHYGKNVTIQGDVRQVISNSAFTITSAENPSSELLVLSSPSSTPAPAQGQRVRVAGIFRAYEEGQARITLADQYNAEQFDAFRDKPMIVATSVQRMGDRMP